MKVNLRRLSAGLLVPAGLGIGIAGFNRYRLAQGAETLPTAPVRQGDFSVIVRCRGELKARRSVQITAPVNVPELRIVWLAPTGSTVKEGDPVVRFDPSAVKAQLLEKRAALSQAQAALDQAVADARIADQQNKLDLDDAHYQVEKAKLQVLKAGILSPLEAEKNKIELGLQEKKLDIQRAKNDFGATSGEAKIASLRRARDKAKDELEVTEYRLQQMERKAPIDGWVSYLPNYSQGWMNAKPFKVGDQVWPGAALAEIPDLSSLEMEGKIEEIDRGRIGLGQEVRVRIDSLPEAALPAKLVMLSPMTVMSWEWPPTRTFRAFAKMDNVETRLRPGMNGAMDVVVNRVANATSVPAKAVFTINGKPTVYVAEGGSYHPVEVKVLARNPDEIAVSGLQNGASVALVEPETKGSRT